MTDRTEELGLAGRLPIQVGGQQVELRTLNLDESEKWKEQVDALGEAELGELHAAQMLDLVIAYDADGVLGSADDLRKKFTQRELHAAVNQMVSAEAPFLEDARSVVEAYGAKFGRSPLMLYLISRSQPESSTNGHSPSGAPPRALSVASSPSNNSSSAGHTGNGASPARHRKSS